MMRTTLAIALCATAALAPAASARSGDDVVLIPYDVATDGSVPFVDLSGVPDTLGDSTGGIFGRSLLWTPTTTTTRTTQLSGAQCTAAASSGSFAASKSAHVNALAVAVRQGCTGEVNWAWRSKVVYTFKKKAAYAVAKAWASAYTSCKSKGNAYGCAAAHAYAQAWAKATVKVHALALAKAVNQCQCRNRQQIAKAASGAYAKEFTTLIADVEASARAATCVKGNAASSAQAYASCVQIIYAKAFAYAAAKAIINGGCGYYYQNIRASTTTTALAFIETWDKVTC